VKGASNPFPLKFRSVHSNKKALRFKVQGFSNFIFCTFHQPLRKGLLFEIKAAHDIIKNRPADPIKGQSRERLRTGSKLDSGGCKWWPVGSIRGLNN
jgi:hypothetical protein